MAFTPRVSVSIIFLNAERFLAEAVESVLSQTFSDWELLLIDDGSNDGSTEIARDYERRHQGRIRYLEHPGHANHGMSASRNLGARHSRGEYLALLDSDDVWLPRKLEKQVKVLDEQPQAGMVYDVTQTWHTWTGDMSRLRDERQWLLGVPENSLIPPPTLISRFLRGDAETPGTCSLMIRAEVWESVGGFDERFRGMFEDQVFLYKICLAHPVYVCDGVSSLYRQHPQSCWHVAAENGLYSSDDLPNPTRRAFLDWVTTYLRERGIEDPEIQRALSEAKRPYRSPRYEILTGMMALKRTARRLLPRPLRRFLTIPIRVYKASRRGRETTTET